MRSFKPGDVVMARAGWIDYVYADRYPDDGRQGQCFRGNDRALVLAAVQPLVEPQEAMQELLLLVNGCVGWTLDNCVRPVAHGEPTGFEPAFPPIEAAS